MTIPLTESPDEKIEWTPQNIVKYDQLRIYSLKARFGCHKVHISNDHDDCNCQGISQKEWKLQVV